MVKLPSAVAKTRSVTLNSRRGAIAPLRHVPGALHLINNNGCWQYSAIFASLVAVHLTDIGVYPTVAHGLRQVPEPVRVFCKRWERDPTLGTDIFYIMPRPISGSFE